MSQPPDEAVPMQDPCEQTRDLLAAYTDGDLPEEELREQVRAHLETCSACREEARAFAELKRQLRALRRHQSLIEPSPHVWKEAQRVWRRRERMQQVRFAWRPALGFSLLLIAIMSFVWARLNRPDFFPVHAVLQDFQQVEAQPIHTAFAKTDPDRAAAWLRDRLDANVPPINLSLSHGSLLGADVVSLDGVPAGRLLYRTPHGLAGVYVVPNHTRFASSLQPFSVSLRTFYTTGLQNPPVVLYAWAHGGNGYALVLGRHSVPRDTLLDAAHATDAPEKP